MGRASWVAQHAGRQGKARPIRPDFPLYKSKHGRPRPVSTCPLPGREQGKTLTLNVLGIAGFHVSRGLQRALGVAGGLGGRCGCVCVLGGRQPSRSGGWRRAVRLSASRCAVRVVVVSVVVHVLRCADCCRARLMWQAAPAPQRGAAPRLQRSSSGCSSSCCSRVPWMPHSRLIALVSSSGGV